MEDRNERNDVEREMVKKVTLDTILIEELGQFGWFQLRTWLLAAVMVIFAAWGASEFVFTTAMIPTRCHIPECELSNTTVFAPEWKPNAIPKTDSGFESCYRFENAPRRPDVITGVCPASLFDTEHTVKCETYIYENNDTVAYDYNLGCDEWKRTLIGSIRTMGTLAALPITGYISDRFGRRVALTMNAFNTAWLGALRYIVNTYAEFTISEFVEAMFGAGGFSCAYILLMEIVGPKYRVAAGASMNSCFSFGQILMGIIAWAVPNWRMFTLALYLPQLITISYLWIMTESIRWYMSKGRYAESEALLKKIAKVNRKVLSDKSVECLRGIAEENKREKELEESERENKPLLIVQVFRNRKILIRCIVSPVWWITNTFVYHGLGINAVNISGNMYLNYIAVAAADIPGHWTAVYLMGKIGRKPVLIGAFWICAACQAGYIFVPEGLYGASLALYLVGKYCIAIVMTSVYVYTAELYPTKYRHSLFAFSSMMGRIGSIIAPLTPAFGKALFKELPFVLFGSFALLSGALIFLTPETLGTTLPDTMEEASNIGQRRTVRRI